MQSTGKIHGQRQIYTQANRWRGEWTDEQLDAQIDAVVCWYLTDNASFFVVDPSYSNENIPQLWLCYYYILVVKKKVQSAYVGYCRIFNKYYDRSMEVETDRPTDRSTNWRTWQFMKKVTRPIIVKKVWRKRCGANYVFLACHRLVAYSVRQGMTLTKFGPKGRTFAKRESLPYSWWF